MGTTEPEQDGRAVACSTNQVELGEGIRWDARRDEMLAVDILAGRVYRGRVRDDGPLERTHVYELPWTVGMIAPVDGDGGWLLGAGRGFAYLGPDGTHRMIAEVSPAGTRMNDGACDPQGRFRAGTLANDHHKGGGALYRLDRTGVTFREDGSLTAQLVNNTRYQGNWSVDRSGHLHADMMGNPMTAEAAVKGDELTLRMDGQALMLRRQPL